MKQDCCCTARAEVLYVKRIQKHQTWLELSRPASLWFVLSWLESAGSTETIRLQYMNIVIQSVCVWSTGRLTSTKVFTSKWYSRLCVWRSASLAQRTSVFLQFRLIFCFCFGIWWFQYVMWNCHKSTITVCLFSSNTSALNTSRLGSMVCEWIERDSESRIPISPTLHRLTTLQSSSHSKPITSPEMWNSLMHWFKILSDKKKIYMYKG